MRIDDSKSEPTALVNAAGARGRMWLSLWALVTGVVLILVARSVNVEAALAVLCLIQAALVWRLARAFRQERSASHHQTDDIRANYESVVHLLSGALSARDHSAAGQSQKVSHLAAIVAWEMGLREEGIRPVEQAAILHDVGKIHIAETVLFKAGALTEHEWADMRRHPDAGYQILKEISFLEDVAEIVHAHHERFDGQGYPRRLKGDEIPLGSRIFAVVDAYVAMTSDRPYRKKMSHDVAIKEIVRNTLTQFDPHVVEGFLSAEKSGMLQGKAEPESLEDYIRVNALSEA
jgi:HD-GYP domain-containing protein (c-di-GMP phosphodiesterase class II)